MQSRVEALKDWMAERDITFRAVGERLGLSGAMASRLLKAERIRPVRFEQLRALGFPKELLPVPSDPLPGGPKRKIPRFPGLQACQSAAS